MDFTYFAGPIEDMSLLVDEDQSCDLCGRTGLCFQLDSAIIPELAQDEKEWKVGCMDCLKDGRFEFWHDTEVGLLDEHGLKHEYLHNKPVPTQFPIEACEVLRRTPQISTWQQEIWLVHCLDFMVYQGAWNPADFHANSPTGDGRSLFMEMTEPELDHLWDSSCAEGETDLQEWRGNVRYYVFRCRHCGKLRGNWDCD